MEKQKTPRLVSTLILTTVTLISWVLFSIYSALIKPQPIVVPQEIIEPIDPQIDSKILMQLKDRFSLDKEARQESNNVQGYEKDGEKNNSSQETTTKDTSAQSETPGTE
jgi:hypothetical protein